MSELRELRLPVELCVKAEEKFGANFNGVEDLLIFVLQELVRGDTLQQDRDDQSVVEERLRDLGYI